MTLLSQESIEAMLQTNAMLTSQLRAKDNKIAILIRILEQRTEATRKAYNPEKIAEMCRKCYEVFLDSEITPDGLGYTETEFLSAFKEKWRFESAHLPQRLRDLVRLGYLWRDDSEGKVVFRLKLVGIFRREGFL